MITKIELDCPDDSTVEFVLQAVSNGVQVLKKKTISVSDTVTIDAVTTIQTITTTITRTIGESITFEP